jgi:large subunit ribosomal protein L24
MKMHVKAKDEVIVISGKDKGVKGKVLASLPKSGKVVVEGVAMVTKHQKSRAQGQPGGIIKKEARKALPLRREGNRRQKNPHLQKVRRTD